MEKKFSVPCARESRGVFAGDDWWWERTSTGCSASAESTFKPRLLKSSNFGCQWTVVESGCGGWVGIMDDGGGAWSIFDPTWLPTVGKQWTMNIELCTAGVIVERKPFLLIYNEEKYKSEDNRIVHLLHEAV
jgi:hypothetical protein